ncbi:MAG: GMC oxidoreductase [Sphingobium sp.]
MMAQDIVVGSGPSGLAAAMALIARGRDVLMLDAGIEMDADAQALRTRMGAGAPDDWSGADREAIGAVRRSEKSDSIRPFGSDFLFRVPAEMAAFDAPNAVHALRPSFAKGGLSNGWGASTLPYHARDLDDWPIDLTDLAPHYQTIAPMIGMSAQRDGLTDFFDAVPITEERPLPQSRQATQILSRMEKKRAELDRIGVHFGASRQAIAPGCLACAMCLYGCPYGLIFNAAVQVERLAAEGSLRYQGGVIVTGFSEHGDGVTVHSTQGVFEGERLFIAAGVLPTAQLALGSLGLADRWLTILDSQHFYLPMLQRWSSGHPAHEPRHTLAQMFWEIDDPAVDPHIVHAQLYTYNDTYAPDMERRFGPFAGLAKPLIEAMSQRLIVAQTFLHSDVSPAIGVRLTGAGARARLEYKRIDNAGTAAAIERAKRRIAQAGRLGGLIPLTPLLRPGSLGSSFHCGGTLPMRTSPEAGETDVLGRPAGWKRVHIVDASVLPTIPAPTITFSVMANAHRIANSA